MLDIFPEALPMLAASTIIAALAVELFIRLPIVPTARCLIALLPKTMRIIRSPKISDHWKEKVLLRYSRELAAMVWKILFYMACIGLSVVAISLVMDRVLKGPETTLEYLSGWQGLSITTAASTVYYVLRNRFV